MTKNIRGSSPNHSHAWRGTWNRPMLIDENTQHPFTIARMTDHNVRGSDAKPPTPVSRILS